MKTKVMMIIMIMMVLASVSMYAADFDYNGVWIIDTANGYMNMDKAKNRIRVIPGDNDYVILMNEKGNTLTYFGSVYITDEDHIVVVTSDDKRIKLVSEDYAIYARELAIEKAKETAKGIGGFVLEAALFALFTKLVEVGAAALFAL